jgi:phosphate transport system substrate-binding protein
MRLRFATLALVAVAGLSAGCGSSDGVSIQGSGATFPAPLYKRWFAEYYREHPDVRVNYQPIGSGAGIRQFTEGLVTFGASDAFMSEAEIKKVPADRGVVLLPMTAGSIAICYNLPGYSGELRLPRKAYVNIFLGRITSWADRAIADANPGDSLPDVPITVVRRSDSSGTTHAFTSHLNAISDDWKKDHGGPGKGKSIAWPDKENFIAGKGNSGVAALIQQTPGAVGYLETGYAELARLSAPQLKMAQLENKSGAFVAATAESGAAALAPPSLVNIPDNLHVEVNDPAGKDAFPIVTCTWLLCARHYTDQRRATELKKVIRYCLTDGQKLSSELGYIPLPPELTKKTLAALDEITP